MLSARAIFRDKCYTVAIEACIIRQLCPIALLAHRLLAHDRALLSSASEAAGMRLALFWWITFFQLIIVILAIIVGLGKLTKYKGVVLSFVVRGLAFPTHLLVLWLCLSGHAMYCAIYIATKSVCGGCGQLAYIAFAAV